MWVECSRRKISITTGTSICLQTKLTLRSNNLSNFRPLPSVPYLFNDDYLGLQKHPKLVIRVFHMKLGLLLQEMLWKVSAGVEADD